MRRGGHGDYLTLLAEALLCASFFLPGGDLWKELWPSRRGRGMSRFGSRPRRFKTAAPAGFAIPARPALRFSHRAWLGVKVREVVRRVWVTTSPLCRFHTFTPMRTRSGAGLREVRTRCRADGLAGGGPSLVVCSLRAIQRRPKRPPGGGPPPRSLHFDALCRRRALARPLAFFMARR